MVFQENFNYNEIIIHILFIRSVDHCNCVHVRIQKKLNGEVRADCCFAFN